MVTKTFRAANMLIALQEVQQELGSDAIVLSVREIPSGPVWQAWKKPGFEVVAMNNAAGLPMASTTPAVTGTAQAFHPAVAVAKSMAASMAPERTLIDWRPPVLKRSGAESQPELVIKEEPEPQPEAKPALAAPVAMPPILARASKRLMDQGVAESLIDRLIDTCLQVLTPAMQADEERLVTFLQRQLEAGVKAPNRSLALVPNQVICLVGTSGSGKTSTCAKLASFYSLTLGKKVAWVSADTIRAGAIAETKVFAENLGIPLHIAYTPPELAECVAAAKDADLILVDTPGCNPRQEEKVVELGGFLTEIPRRATYLVASATTKDVDLNQALAAFGPFNLKGLMITKIDETGTYGSIYNLAWRSQLPLMFCTTGRQIVGDLRSGDASDLALALLTGRYPMRAKAE